MSPAILDSIESIKELDSQNMLASIELLSEQMKSVFGEAQTVKIPASYAKAKQIVVCGMGGSALASHAIKTLFASKLSVPFEIINGYALPARFDKSSCR
jgi:fructoselysine-6-P-deglycase FrlB-like protein